MAHEIPSSTTDAFSCIDRSIEPLLEESSTASSSKTASSSLATQPRLHFLSQITSRLKNIDGIDETAASLALIRGITGPIAAESVFIMGFPFVVFGLMGMMEESAEARAALMDLTANQNDLQTELLNLVSDIQNPSANPRLAGAKLKRLEQHVLQRLNQMPADQAEQKVTACIKALAKLKQFRQDYTQALINRLAAPFGQTAMFGMTAGMIPGMTWGAAEIAARALGENTPSLAKDIGAAALPAQVSALAGAGVSMAFAPANAAMAVYAGLKASAGVQRAKQLNQLNRQIQAHWGHSPLDSRCKLLQQYVKAEHKTNRQTQSVYGVVTAASQAALSGSGALSIAAFFGASAASIGATAGAIIPVLGAAGAISAAGMRIRGEIAADIRRGDAEQPTVQHATEVFNEQVTSERSRSGKQQLDEASDSMMNAHHELAKHKLLSLAMHAVQMRHTPEGRSELLERWVFELGGRRGRFWGKGTSLLPETVKAMRAQYNTKEMQSLLADAFMLTHKGDCAGLLIQSLGLNSHEAVASSMSELKLQDEVIKQLDREVRYSRSAPLDVQSSFAQTRAKEKLTLLLRKAYESCTNPKQRIKRFDQLVKRETRSLQGKHNQKTKSHIQELSRLLHHREKFTDRSRLDTLMSFTRKTEFEKYSLLCGLDQAQNNKALLSSLLTEPSKMNWVKNRLQKIAAPKLIDRYKNSSKVALNKAFLKLQEALTYKDQETELLNQLNEI